MNLAIKDIQHNVGRFILTVLGIGLLLMIVMGMAGIYRGLIEDATLLVERIDADLWIVQKNTRGPFAEVSRVPESLVYRVQAVPGVRTSREFVYHTIQRQHDGKPLRMSMLGLSWPLDKGEWLPLIAGRALSQNHFELIADRTLGFEAGDRITLGKETTLLSESHPEWSVPAAIAWPSSRCGILRPSSLIRPEKPSDWNARRVIIAGS